MAVIASLFLQHFLLLLQAHEVRQREFYILCAVIGAGLNIAILRLNVLCRSLLSLLLDFIFSRFTRPAVHFGALLEISRAGVFVTVLHKFIFDVFWLLESSDLTSI